MMGGTPVRPDCFGGCFPNYFTSSWYGAVGVNMSVPIFNGFLFSAQASKQNPGPISKAWRSRVWASWAHAKSCEGELQELLNIVILARSSLNNMP